MGQSSSSCCYLFLDGIIYKGSSDSEIEMFHDLRGLNLKGIKGMYFSKYGPIIVLENGDNNRHTFLRVRKEYVESIPLGKNLNHHSEDARIEKIMINILEKASNYDVFILKNEGKSYLLDYYDIFKSFIHHMGGCNSYGFINEDSVIFIC